MTNAVRIVADDPASDDVLVLIKRHLEHSYTHSPETSVHALDVSDLTGEDITFWTVRVADEVAGCAALKVHDANLGEVKSMHVAEEQRGKGLAKILLNHIIEQARLFQLAELKLETGSMAAYAPARQLYERAGFSPCEPFAHYTHDPNSAYYRLELKHSA